MTTKFLKIFTCDLNWAYFDLPYEHASPSLPQDFAFINPLEYFNWHRQFGNNCTFLQAYTFCGYAFYPSRLGPVAPGQGGQLMPRLYDLSLKHNLPFCGYFSVNIDLITSNLRDEWVIPTSRNHAYSSQGFLAPESPWTDLLCERINEFLTQYPVEYLQFDMFDYGGLGPDFAVQPAWFVKQPFSEIIGRQMPDSAGEITPEESLKYKRAVLARQFQHIRETVKQTSPRTQIGFNVPFFHAAEPLWVDHAMLAESDFLVAESSREEIIDWLISVRKPGQSVMTTVIGHPEKGQTDPHQWRKLVEKGCDMFFGYAWGTPPDFHPHHHYDEDLAIVHQAFLEMAG